MSTFGAYFQLGLEHLMDFQGYDHMLFLLVLCAAYMPKDWRKVAWMITAFTIGHSLTLALAVLDLVSFSSTVIEVLIPITIMLTAVVNVLYINKKKHVLHRWGRYALVLFFGLIHGLGFSNFLKSLLIQQQDLFEPLLAFNLGLEAAQLLIMSVIMLVMFGLINGLKLPHRIWNTVISAGAFGISILLILQKL